jgi:hypothetical protein
MAEFSEKEREMLAWLLRKERRLNASGNYMSDFSERMVGPRLFKKMPSEWSQWTGFYLSGALCYRLSTAGRKAIRALVGSVSTPEVKP